ncbi:aspartoacylase [Corallincola luteus]|uniref:Aspartoacylase n=1 Tax=Corallincola luteus TaxID=1775177 RepID=A0ABY2AM71_9GAMM|nr:aspartoacylase [Corallincola luteus]TCI04050.1 aspartoacylase [Corallincola luteus]
MSEINKVTIVGGTHGNEFTGVYLVKKWQQQPAEVTRSSFTTSTLWANPKAHEQNKRYCDQDLNRQFTRAQLDDVNLVGYEQSRAKIIDAELGPKGDAKCDFVIDLHTTTSNMGPCLLLTQQGKIYRQLAAYVKMQMPEAVIFRDEDHLSAAQHHLLATVGTYGVIVEVGPVPQSVIRQDVLEQSAELTRHILDFIEHCNLGTLPSLPQQVKGYRYLESIKLPVDANGQRLGMVHNHVQDNDFKPLHPGDPLFMTFAGETITYQGADTVYPAFINEAAYYDNNLAMSLLEKVVIDVE